MIDTLGQLRVRAHALWRRRWLALGTAWALMLIGSTIVILLPDQYESSSRVYVDTDSLMGPLLKGIAVQDDLTQQLAIMQSTLLSRPNLTKVVRSVYPSVDATNEIELENLSEHVRSRTSIQVTSPKLFHIAYVDPDPRLAKDVVQSLLGLFVDNSLGSDRADMESAQAFIAKQIEFYETELRAAESRITEFRAKNADLISSGKSFSERLDAARMDAEAAAAELTAVKNKDDRPTVQTTTTAQTSQVTSPGEAAKDPTLAKLAELRAQLNQKLAIYSDQHPDVIALKRQLAGLEQANIAVSEQRLNSANEKLKRLQERATSAARLEAQMADMNRDYNVLKEKYDELRVRAELARISSDAKTDTEAMRFRVVDPPNVASGPSGPKRTLLLLAVLLASLGGGIALAFLLSEMDDSFATPSELRAAFDLPVLGSVCLVSGKADEHRRYYDSMTVVLGTGALAVLCGLLISLNGIMRSALDLSHFRHLASSLFGS